MKEDKLERFVRERAKDFNDLEPPAMAWDAIEKELPAEKKRLVRRLWPVAWKVAAAVLIFASAWMLNDFSRERNHPDGTAGSHSSGSNMALNELSDAEAYYTSQISSRQAELSAYAKQHPEIMEDLKKEFLEMDKKKAELKKDLAQSHADEKVIEAIILSYRVKLGILEEMLGEFRKTNGEEPDAKQTNL
jgi:hypothetical protein